MATAELTEGDRAPTFVAASNQGEVDLEALRGHPVVLYFYPRDNTSGCTREACDFRDAGGELQALGVTVLGVSKDSLTSHERFAGKHDLAFPLIADPELSLITAYGVWKEKKMYGRTSMGVERSTFLIDGDGVVRRVWRKVRVSGHVDAVLEAARSL